MDMDDGNGSEYLLLVEKFTMAEEKKETAEEVKEPNILEQLREEREKGEKVLAEFKERKRICRDGFPRNYTSKMISCECQMLITLNFLALLGLLLKLRQMRKEGKI